MSKLEIIFRRTDDIGDVYELTLNPALFLVVLDFMKHIDEYQILEMERLLCLAEWKKLDTSEL